MSYSDEWLKHVRATVAPEPRVVGTPPVEPVPVASTTWKPWSQMTAEERRKALEKREEKP